MNKTSVSHFFKRAQSAVSEHSPEILTGVGIAGMITTTVLAVKATPKALKLIEEKKKEERMDELPIIETVKVAWMCYIPAAVTCAASVACLIGASSVSLKRNAALATAYKLSETALTEYKGKVIETIGEKKEQAIREKIAEEKLEKNPVSNNQVFITEKGNTLCYDAISGRYFKSDIEKIRKVANELNRRMMTDIFGYISLNEFYDEIGLDRIDVGDDLGWSVDHGLIDIEPHPGLAEDETPCIVIDFRVAPRYGYSKIG